MASGLHQWESDPLFYAAEVVQDSADRMESVFRSLVHDLSLVQGDPTTDGQEVEDSSILRRFLDPTTSSGKDSASGIVEHKSREILDLNMNGVVHVDRVIESIKENNLRKVGSYNRFGEGGSWDIGNTRLKSDFTDSFPETSCNRYGGGESWDLEANESKRVSFSRTNVLGFLNTAWSVYGSRVTGSFTKRFKDGEEESHSPSSADVSHGAQGQHQGRWLYTNSKELCMGIRAKVMYLRTWLGVFRARYERSPYHIQVQQHSIQVVLIILLTLVILAHAWDLLVNYIGKPDIRGYFPL